MGLGRVGTFVSHGKKRGGSTKPKESRDFYRRELFRSGDGIFLLDRNPIWMTPRSRPNILFNIHRLIMEFQHETFSPLIGYAQSGDAPYEDPRHNSQG